MKYVGSDSGRVIQLYSLEDIRPPGGLHLLEFREAMINRYGFAEVPTNEQLVHDNQTVFRNGKLIHADGGIAFKELNFTQNGLVLTADNTDDAMMVFQDLVQWMASKFRFQNLENLSGPYFTSTIVVEFDAAIEPRISFMKRLAKLFQREMTAVDGRDIPFGMRRLSFSRDQSQLPPNVLAGEFIVERREGAEYEKNRYFCQGPIATSKLVQVMEDFETLVSEH